MTVDEAMALAVEHHQAGRLGSAESIYRQVLAVVPDHSVTLHLLGLVAYQSGQSQLAVDLIRRSLSITPDAAVYSNLGEVLRESGRLEDAVACYHQAIALNPNMAAAYSNLGLALQRLRRFEEAEGVLRRALLLDQGNGAAYQNLCNTLGDLGKTSEAVAAGRRAVELLSQSPSAWSDFGVACVEDNNLAGAREAFERSLVLEPGRADTHHNLGQVLLRMGEFERGWEEYEWRWRCRDFPSPIRDFGRPVWKGERLEGRTILLHAEQGLGDAMMFARYIPMVAEKGGRVIVECQGEVLPLLRSVAPDLLYVRRGDGLPDFDCHCPFLSLPRVFGTRVETIPAAVPYLHADPDKVAAWCGKLDVGAKLKVGIAWAGRPEHQNDHNRSTTLERFAGLGMKGVVFYSLQVGPAAAQADRPVGGMKLVNLSPELHDYSDTAAVLANLDLIVAVDTSIVHAAGAMGRKVWVLLPFAGDWRWIAGREDSPWYPTMRLFRQQKWGDWEGVFQRVRAEISQLIN